VPLVLGSFEFSLRNFRVADVIALTRAAWGLLVFELLCALVR
jgi:hypothetical protein